MSALSIQSEQTGSTHTLHLNGTFDAVSARALNVQLEALAGREVVLDFRRVRQFSDAGVAVASRGLQACRARLVGLDHHRERLFRYFGVEVSAEARAAWGASEERAPAR
jgi:anti-anti-sigma regulatory factor